MGNPDQLSDMQKFMELLQRNPQFMSLLRPPDPMEQTTVAQVVDWYLKDARAEICPERLVSIEHILRRFVEKFGNKTLAECNPMDLKAFVRDDPRWKSDHTKHTVHTCCQRPFNWARKARLIRENPFQGISFRKGDPRDEMTEEQYRAMLRASPAYFRRVLVFMRFTGCRPGEVRELKWENVDTQRRRIRLDKHKTKHSQKTPRPRIIPLVVVTRKLLEWIRRNQKEEPMAVIRDILKGGPVSAREFRKLASRRGVSLHDLYKLARQAGAKCRKVGPVGPRGFWVWELDRPENFRIVRIPGRRGFYAKFWHRGRAIQKKLADDLETAKRRLEALLQELGADQRDMPQPCQRRGDAIDRKHVFLNREQQPWTKAHFSNMMQRGRPRADVPPTVRLYGLRHHFASELARANINIQIVAEWLGHTTLTMASWYCHTYGDVGLLIGAAEQAMQARSAARGDGNPGA